MILQTLNKQRHSLGQIIATIFIMAWLSLVYQTCAMAMMPDNVSGNSLQTSVLLDGTSDMRHGSTDKTPPCCTLGMQDRDQAQVLPKLNSMPDDVTINILVTESNQRVFREDKQALLVDQSLDYSPPPTTILFGVWHN